MSSCQCNTDRNARTYFHSEFGLPHWPRFSPGLKSGAEFRHYSAQQHLRTPRRNVVVLNSVEVGNGSVSAGQPPPYTGPVPETLTLSVGDREWTLETGEIARQANGAVVARAGDTILLSTVCCSEEAAASSSFLPFTVNYFERFSAAGKTSGAFNKRNPRQGISEVLTSRLVDRPLRPMFKKGWLNETQVLSWVLSYDGVHATEPLAITSAGTALALSDIPFSKCVAGVRVGYLPDDGFVLNPTVEQMASSTLDLVVAGTAEAVLMIEGYCDFMTEEQMLEAVRIGHGTVSVMCHQITDWAQRVGKAKRVDALVVRDPALENEVQEMVSKDIEAAYRNIRGEKERAGTLAELLSGAKSSLSSTHSEEDIAAAFKRVQSGVMRRLVLSEGFRADGRRPDEVRPISSRASLLPRTHGSALFTRGETQSLAVTTLGGRDDAQRLDEMTVEDDDDLQHFYLQYNFPPCSVGEVGRVGGQGRREVGHGRLAERALIPVVPDESSFPYTVRVESTITESNGSSSMASVCGGCLSMMDAGVPVKSMVAGVAMGLILEPTGEFTILTDILGSEDALGDMDFKVAGNESGITAFQMDIKVEGITLDIMEEALSAAKAGRWHILGEMSKCNPAPRKQLSPFAPRIKKLFIDPSKVGLLIGSGGRTIKGLIEKAACEDISVDQSGCVEILSSNEASMQTAIELVMELTTDPEMQVVYRGTTVVQVAPFGCIVKTRAGRTGLVHVSELDVKYVDNPADTWKEGDLMDVAVLALQDNGNMKLSRKQVLIADAAAAGIVLEVEQASPRGRPQRCDPSSVEDSDSDGSSNGERRGGQRRYVNSDSEGGSTRERRGGQQRFANRGPQSRPRGGASSDQQYNPAVRPRPRGSPSPDQQNKPAVRSSSEDSS